MEQTVQRRRRWRAVCASLAILCCASLTSAPAAPVGPGHEPPGETLEPTTTSSPSAEAATSGLAGGGTLAYIINLESSLQPVSPSSVVELPGFEHYRLYTTQFEKDGKTWHRLRLGFFASERDARQALEALRSLYPRAWVAKVSPGEAKVSAQVAIRETAPLHEVPGLTTPGAAASGDTAA